MQSLRLRALLRCLLLVLAAAGARAQTWPSRPIKLIVPTGPGAATDVMARLSERWRVARARSDRGGREHARRLRHPGAPGGRARGARRLHASCSPTPRAWPSISSRSSSFLTIRCATSRRSRSVCSQGPQMVSVNSALPVQYGARADRLCQSAIRGKLSIAFDTTAGAAAVAARLFNRRADLGLIEVPYRSAAQMAQDVATGVNPVLMSSIAAATAVVQAGKVRRLAVTSAKRFVGLPDLPALNETLPGRRRRRLVRRGRARRHAARHRRADQSRDRRIPQKPGNPAAAHLVRTRHRAVPGRPTATGQLIREHPRGLAGAGAGTRYPAAVTAGICVIFADCNRFAPWRFRSSP